MKNLIKKYWTHIFNLIFLLYIISLFMFINFMEEKTTSIEILNLLLIIILFFVIGIWIEIIYFIIKVIKTK